MGRTRRKTLLRDMADAAAFHWHGKPPILSTDFVHGDRGAMPAIKRPSDSPWEYARKARQWLEDRGYSPDAWWTINDASGASEFSDLTGQHPLTINGSPTLEQSPLVDGDAHSALFDGSGDYGESNDGGSPTWASYIVDGTQVFTVAGWVRPDAQGDEVASIFNTKDAGDDGLAILRESRSGQGTDQLRVIHEANGNLKDFQSADGVLGDGQLHHIAVTGDGSKLRVYVDGEKLKDTTIVTDAGAHTSNVFLGAQTDGAGGAQRLFPGELDEWFVGNFALSQSDIQTLYEMGYARAKAPYSLWSGTEFETATKNGNPQPTDPIGTGDAKSQDFEGDPGHFSASAADAVDNLATESLTGVFVFRANSNNNGLTDSFAGKYNGTNAGMIWRLRNDGALFFRVGDNSGNGTQVGVGFTGRDGLPHLACGVFDRDASELRIYGDDSAASTGSSPSGFGSQESSAPIQIGDRGQSSDPYNDELALALIQQEWYSDPQRKFLYNLLVTGDVAPGTWARLRSMFYGHREGKLRRRIPSYLTDAFGADGPDFWWSADRQIRHVDGEGVVQLTDHSGTNSAVQRTSSSQPTARGEATRGQPLEYLEATGSESYPAAVSVDPSTGWSGFIVASGLTSDGFVVARRDSTDSDHLLFRIRSADFFELSVTDSDGDNNFTRAADPADFSQNFVGVWTWSPGNFLQIWAWTPATGAVNVKDTKVSSLDAFSGTDTNDYFLDDQNSIYLDADIEAFAEDDGTLTDTEGANLRDSLKNVYGFS